MKLLFLHKISITSKYSILAPFDNVYDSRQHSPLSVDVSLNSDYQTPTFFELFFSPVSFPHFSQASSYVQLTYYLKNLLFL